MSEKSRILAIPLLVFCKSFIYITTEKREVLPANNLTLDFIPPGKSLICIKKIKVPKWPLEDFLPEQSASLNIDRLEELFEIYQPNNA